MTFRSPSAVPPIVVFEPLMNTPELLPRAAVPVGSVPMKFPAITSPLGDPTKTPELLKRLITSPRTVMPGTESVRPFALAPRRTRRVQ